MCLLNVKCEMSLINEISDIGLYRPSYKVPRFKVHVPGFVSVSFSSLLHFPADLEAAVNVLRFYNVFDAFHLNR